MTDTPFWCKDFKCIADKCPNTCCRGWEVDIDEDSYYYYQTVKGNFGDKLRRSICEEDGIYFFPLIKDGRCPHLQDDNLCRLYIELGEDHLCRTCKEYPRSFVEYENYTQWDVTLSCPEAARLLFSDEYKPGLITLDRTVHPSEELARILNDRSKILADIADRKDELAEQIDPHFDDALMNIIEKMEPLTSEWPQTVSYIEDNRAQLQDLCAKKAGCMPQDIRDCFYRLAYYLVFHYYADALYDGSEKPAERLITNYLRIFRLICLIYSSRIGCFCKEDLKELEVKFSRQVEHSSENINILKELT